MKDFLTLISKIHPLSKPFRQYLANHLKTLDLSPKEYLLKAGSISHHLYFVKKGLVRCYYIEREQEVCSKFLQEYDIIVSASSFFHQQASTEYIQAIEYSELIALCYDEFQYIYKYYIESNIISRVLSTKSYLLSEERSYSIRMKQAPERYEAMLKLYPALVNRLPMKYLASYSGITEETLSRIRARKY